MRLAFPGVELRGIAYAEGTVAAEILLALAENNCQVRSGRGAGVRLKRLKGVPQTIGKPQENHRKLVIYSWRQTKNISNSH